MKSVATKILALLLAALMVLPMVACGENTDDPNASESGTQAGAVTEGETERQPTVEKKDYQGAEFVAIYCSDTFNNGYFFIEEENRKPGSDLDDALYERMMAVDEWLGVEVIAEDGGNFQEYTAGLKTSISSGDDSYQMVMTHVYQEVASLITSNYLRDFNDFDSASTWRPIIGTATSWSSCPLTTRCTVATTTSAWLTATSWPSTRIWSMSTPTPSATSTSR